MSIVKNLMCLQLASLLLRQVDLLKDICHKLLKVRILGFSLINHEIDHLHNNC